MANPKRVLILGGTGDAAELARRAAELPSLEVITALAGRTHQPVMPTENTRIGGFGGVAGLKDYLREQQIDGLVDATHPFAAQISFNASRAATAVGIPHLRLIRPAWQQTESDRWLNVESYEAAAQALPGLAQRVFLTIGRQKLPIFAHLTDLWFLMRMVDPPRPDTLVPPGRLLLKRGSFLLEEERSLLQQYEIGAIVSKNSGGDTTYAKIIAARELAIPVVMVQRPLVSSEEQRADVESALQWLIRKLAT
jgi:precorrin-6A/cobalt-precorrin-6A reductase